jgi:hypothetical protein
VPDTQSLRALAVRVRTGWNNENARYLKIELPQRNLARGDPFADQR